MLDRLTNWHSRHRFLALNLALAIYVGAQPIAAIFHVGERVLPALLVFALLSASFATDSSSSTGTRRALSYVAALALVVSAIVGDAALYPGHVLGVVLLCWCTASIFKHVIRAAVVDTERMHAAVSVYLLIGTTFSLLYTLLVQVEPGAFAHRFDDVRHLREILTYFSYVTLTTLGFGDVTPVHPIARSLAVMEALVGQLYLTILVARLVGLSTAGGTTESAPRIDARESR